MLLSNLMFLLKTYFEEPSTLEALLTKQKCVRRKKEKDLHSRI